MDKQPTVITPNYHNRAKKNWLVRGNDQKLSAVKEVSTVYAKDVSFVTSSDGEAGYGCGIVALAKEYDQERAATIHPDAVRIRFNGGYNFYVNSDTPHCHVAKVKELWLNDKGEMFAAGITFNQEPI